MVGGELPAVQVAEQLLQFETWTGTNRSQTG